MSAKKEVKSNWYAIALDHTEYWLIPEEYKPYIKAMGAYYVYDANRHVYCCEVTPSYELWFVENFPVFTDDVTDEIREDFFDWMAGAWDEDVAYMHVIDIDRMPLKCKEQHGHWGEDDCDETEEERYLREKDEMVEACQGNTPDCYLPCELDKNGNVAL